MCLVWNRLYFCKMRHFSVPRSELAQFSAFSAQFHHQEQFSQWLNQPFVNIATLNNQLIQKKQQFPNQSRSILIEVLKEQTPQLSQLQEEHLNLLANENTFTITTGHQLTLFGGPIYMIFKILHVVKLARQFNQTNVEDKVVPIFWMASEDHDFEEIHSTQLFQREISWNQEGGGAVGRRSTEGLAASIQELAALFEGKETEIQDLLSLPIGESYAEYFQRFMNVLMADFGVLVLNPDDKRLKNLFVPVMERELLTECSLEAVQATNQELIKAGLKPQANAREINLFYLKNGERVRVESLNGKIVIDGEVLTIQEAVERVKREPEQFSPNVILRPVYQETILPNLVYVGGGGEMAYWLQLKRVFEAHNTLFPLLQQRFSGALVDEGTLKKMEKYKLNLSDFVNGKEGLRKRVLSDLAGDDLDVSGIEAAFQHLKEEIINKSKSIDVALESWAEAEMVRMRKQVEQMEQRFVKTLKQRNEQVLKVIDQTAERLYPNGGLQERFYHWLHFCPTGSYKTLFHAIFEELDPFDPNLVHIAV